MVGWAPLTVQIRTTITRATAMADCAPKEIPVSFKAVRALSTGKAAMQSVLITGGAGFIGQNLVHAWRAAHPNDRLVVVDAMTYAANVRSLEPLIRDHSIEFVRGDIKDASLIRRLFDE